MGRAVQVPEDLGLMFCPYESGCVARTSAFNTEINLAARPASHPKFLLATEPPKM